MRLAWLSDVHLEFAGPEALQALTRAVCDARPDVVLVGGDVSQANRFADDLRDLFERFDVPLYFVLGNHDYYGGSIVSTRAEAKRLHARSESVHWLPAAGVVPLTDDVALVGHGGWGDGREGGFHTSDVLLNDYFLIEELRLATFGESDAPPEAIGTPLPESLYAALNRLGDEAAEHLRHVVATALQSHAHVYVLMHVPPFREACWHEGRISDDNWAPHFVCQAAGAALRQVLKAHPEGRATVLCGHTHGEGYASILPNLEVHTAGAVYGAPALERVFDVG